MIKPAQYPLLIRPTQGVDTILNERPPLTGDYYWTMGESDYDFYDFGTTDIGIFDTAISIQAGDVVTITIHNDVHPLSDARIISSTDGNQYIGGNGINNATFESSGWLVTLDGVILESDDDLPTVTNSSYRNEYTLIATALVDTDIKYLNSDNSLVPSGIQPIRKIEVSGSQALIYKINQRNSAVQTETNEIGSDLTLTPHVNNDLWRHQYHEINKGKLSQGNVDSVVFDESGFDSNNDAVSTLQDSLRLDELGNSIEFLENIPLEQAGLSLVYLNIPYSNGLTGECLIKPNGFSNATGTVCGVISSLDAGLWIMGFDNYQDPLNSENEIYPFFALLQRGTRYDRTVDYSNILVEVRSNTQMQIGKIYHLMFTIRPSNNTIEFWVDGESQGSIGIPNPDDWFIPNGEAGSEDLLIGYQETNILIGPRPQVQTFLSGQGSNIQDVKLHLLEATQEIADRESGTLGIAPEPPGTTSVFFSEFQEGDPTSPVIYSNGDSNGGFNTILIDSPDEDVWIWSLSPNNVGARQVEFTINSITNAGASVIFGLYGFKGTGGQYQVSINGDGQLTVSNNVSTLVAGSTVEDGDVFSFLVDFDNEQVDILRNGINTGQSLSLASDYFSSTITPFVRVLSGYSGQVSITCAFSEGNYSDFQSGYSAWDDGGLIGIYQRNLFRTASTGIDLTSNTGVKNGESFGGAWSSIIGNKPLNQGDKLYFEGEAITYNGYEPNQTFAACGVGVIDNFITHSATSPPGESSNARQPGILSNGTIYNDGSQSSSFTWGEGDVIGCAIDWPESGSDILMDVYINNIFQVTLTNPITSNEDCFYPIVGLDNLVPVGGTIKLNLNASDQNYSPPSGFLPWDN